MNKPPVLLVASLSQPARHALVQSYLRTCSPEANLAWLDNQDRPARLENPQPDQSFTACACCAGSVVFSTWLTRLLRARRPAGIIICLSARAEPHKLMALLSEGPWRPVLGPLRLVSVMDELARSVLDQPDHALYEAVRQQRDLSWRVLGPGDLLPADPFPAL